MDDVTPMASRSRRFTALNLFFAALVGAGLVYILWRGFASEATRQMTPLFGHTSVLEWQGAKHRFVLVNFADLNTVKEGELLIRAGEVPARVRRVAMRSAEVLTLEASPGGQRETVTIPMPATETTPRYVLLAPADGQ